MEINDILNEAFKKLQKEWTGGLGRFSADGTDLIETLLMSNLIVQSKILEELKIYTLKSPEKFGLINFKEVEK